MRIIKKFKFNKTMIRMINKFNRKYKKTKVKIIKIKYLSSEIEIKKFNKQINEIKFLISN